MKKRILSLVLTVCMICTMLPAMAFADDEIADEEQIVAVENEDGAVEDAEEAIESTDDLSDETTAGEEPAVEEESEDLTVEELEETNADGDIHVTYNGHVQTYGWQEPWSKDGETAGTFGQSKRVEAIHVKLQKEVVDANGDTTFEDLKDAISYQAHVQTYGWQKNWSKDGELAGTTGESKRVEAFKLKLSEPYATQYDIYYCVHAQRYGWLNWAKNGEPAGTEGYSLRLEAIKIKLVKKGGAAPLPVGETPVSFVSPNKMGMINYKTHVQTYGWQDTVADGATAGTSGESKRMEAFQIWLDETIPGSVEYNAHVQTYGWQKTWSKDGATAGTSGESKRVEAVKIKLSGEAADKYHIFYRVHSQTFGTLGWAKDGEPAGSEGFSKRLENMEIQLVEKTDTAKIAELSGGRAFVSGACIPKLGGSSYSDEDGSWLTAPDGKKISLGSQGLAKELQSIKLKVNNSDPALYQGYLSYKVLTEDGWSASASNNKAAGVAGSGKKIEAVQISVKGELATYCDVYYRAYCQKYGWLGWAKSGASAGTQDYDLRLEALEVTLVEKNGDAPGSTSGAFLKFNPKFNDMTNRVQGLTSGTGYLIAVDCTNNLCGVYTGSRNNWKLLYAWTCTTGAPATPTCKGQYSIIYKKPYFGDTYTAWYASFFQSAGYAFHSVLYLPGSKTQFRDPRLGMALSHGCVRLAIENAEWIYNNCGGGTRVYTYS